MRHHGRSLAVLTLIALAAVGVEFSPAIAAPPSAAVLAAGTSTSPPITSSRPTTTSRPTSSSTSSSTRPTTTTTTVTDCTPVAPTVTFTQSTATNLNFYYSSPSGYQCGVLRSTTLALYSDAAHTSLVNSRVLPVGTRTGAVAFSGLTPSTDYYLVLSIDVTWVPATSWPATRTAAGSSGTATTTTTTTSYPCDYGGPAAIAPVESTTTSITYTYSYSANACGKVGNGTLRVFLYTDAALTQLAKEWGPPSGANEGAALVSGLAPATTYYGKYQTYGPLGYSSTFASFTTRSAATTTIPTTTRTIVCDPMPAQASFDSATSTSLRFAFTSIGATGCYGSGTGVTTISVYSDSAYTKLVGTASSADAATSGFLTVGGLTPNTTYYPSVRLSNSPFGSPGMPAVKTLPSTNTTTTSTTTTRICDPAGAEASFDSATSTSLRFAFVAGGANYCSGGGPYITTISVYSDSAHSVLVGSASSADRAASGFLTVSGLTPNTTYYPLVKMSGSPFGPSILPAVRTLPTTTTCQPIGLAGPSAITSTGFTWTLPSSLCATTLTATAYASQADATAAVNPIKAVTVTLPASSLTLGGLQPSRDYWVRFSGGFGLQGPLHTAAGGTTTTVTCDPVPSTATYLTNSIASVTFTFNAPGGAACGGGVTTITLYKDAEHTVAAASASSARGATSGTLEVGTLNPGTVYYPVVRLDTSPFSSPTMPAVATQPFGTVTGTTTSTIPLRPCVATWQTVSAWPGGFLGQITIKNTSATVSSSWKVAWTWTGSARLTASFHATLGGTAISPTLAALDWNRVLQPGASTTIQVQGTATDALATPTIGCTLG
jgi:hypothetical protein